MDRARVVEEIRRHVPDVIAIYLFGSQARGDATPASDFDLAVLARAPIADRFGLQETLAAIVGRDVDLVDLRDATTVMRAQVFKDDELLFESDRNERARFEMYALSDYARLNEERRGILDDARRSGTILG